MSIYKEIDRIIRVVESRMGGHPFVCVQASDGKYGHEIRMMVKRHIGKHPTMNSFLTDKLGTVKKQVLVNQYRILMLKNMKKMLRDDAKKKHALREVRSELGKVLRLRRNQS